MAVYTTELRSICESLSGNKLGSLTETAEIIETARQQIFDFPYDLYNPDYKPVLETKIIRHYYTREIGLETYGLWKFKLETKMLEILPYFNKLYESADLKYDILHDYFVERVHYGDRSEESNSTDTGNTTNTGNVNTTDTTNGTTQASGKDVRDGNTHGTDTTDTHGDSSSSVKNNQTTDGTNSGTTETAFSDTPQGALAGVDRLEYLTTFTKADSSGKTTDDLEGTSSTTTTDNGLDTFNTERDTTDTTTYGRKDTNVVDKDTETNTRNTGSSVNSRVGNINSTDKYIETVTGKMGGKLYPEMVQAYRDTLLNIDVMFIRELKDLFMQIY